VSGLDRRLISFALTAVLVVGLAAPALADDHAVAEARATLQDLATRIHESTQLTERLTNAQWDTEVATAVDIAGIDRIEQELAITRVQATAALETLIGPHSTGQVSAAITATMISADKRYADPRDLTGLLGAWNDFQATVDSAIVVRDALRQSLGLPAITNLRICPLEEAALFEHDWGDSRGWRTHKGTDLMTATGTPLLSMEDGVIIQADWHYLGGNGIYVKGDVTGDVYYYAHLSEYAGDIAVGTRVEAGQVIGYVGTTGNASVPHLHLGWMPGGGGLENLQDAYPMLVELCR